MTQDQTPSLRFPEFRGAWEIKPLGEQGDFLPSLTGKTRQDFGSGNAKFITYLNVFNNTFVNDELLNLVNVADDEKQNCVQKGDVFFTVSSETPEDAGMSSVLLKNIENCYLNSFCAMFRFSLGKTPNLIFIGFLLRQSVIRSYLSTRAQGATRFNLSRDAFRNLPIYLPAPAEQDKIAECLLSLDEVIKAQGDRLDGLKDYKRGLMQQLFPTDGQTTPTLRFPEFQGKAPWEKKRLNEVLNSISNGLNLEQVKEITSYKVTRIETISNDVINTEKVGYIKPEQDISSYKLNIGDMLYSNINSLSHIGRVVIIDRDYNLYHGMNLLRLVVDKNLNNPQFIYYLLNTEEMKLSFKSRANPAVNQASINQTELSKTRIIVPPPAEQQKIADCLSVMDDLITEQEQKIKTLKHHKNGLMQQLFPKL